MCALLKWLLILSTIFPFVSCDREIPGKKDLLFIKLSPGKTGISFENTLTETDSFNYYLYPYMYMGGGVSVADFNNDGKCDIYFTGNMSGNRLYLNQGNLEFTDITKISGTAGDERWMLGSTVCDINNDGLKDIYISVSGLYGRCENLLFVNQGNNKEGIPVFTEEAAQYGINDNGKSTQTTFFDYDNDGDLDLYVANYPITQFQATPYFYRQMMKNVKNDDSGHLYRNNGDGTFTNVTAESGLLTFGLSLSATVSDLNQDGFKDIYISNDFTSPDFFFINNGNGTFTDRTGEVVGQTSFYGMGADIADYNNDGLPDIIQIDMAPEDNQRAKENMTSMKLEDFNDMVNEGLHHQYRYSTLQLNRGIMENGLPYFSNAAWLAGVTSTDWSWAALFADFDLDGWKDLFITNGSRRDINNIDYFNEMTRAGNFDKDEKEIDYLNLLRKMPFKPLENYLYKNNGDLTFTKMNSSWGITDYNYSNGTAYADLDNDGDLELIVNNIDDKAAIYLNTAREKNLGNYVKIGFAGPKENHMGIGTSVTLWTKGQLQTSELTLSRGYESSVEPLLYFGLADEMVIDSIVVRWPDNKIQKINDVSTNQHIAFSYADAIDTFVTPARKKIFEEISDKNMVNFMHKENVFNDYRNQLLLPHKLSETGPDIAVGDINNDGLEDFFIGNASRSPGRMFIQQKDGTFSVLKGPWENDSQFEDTGCLLFDADNDGDIDLYVVSGGNEYPAHTPEYQDRLYINQGKGVFTKEEKALPLTTSSGSCVKPIDFDQDGDLDLFIGGRHVPGKYPFPAESYLLENKSTKGNILFENVTQHVAPDLINAGMVTDALVTDLNGDNWPDLIIAGEWMPVCIFKNTGGKFEKEIIPGTNGWWFSLKGADMDGDGDFDFIGGNLGLNNRYRTAPGKTLDVYAGDFDKNGSSDIAVCYYQGENQYPLRGRECYVSQNPGLALKFPTYASFGKATISEIYSEDILSKSLHLQAEIMASCYFENTGDGNFLIHPLPNEAQLSSINDIIIDDFNEDGFKDIIAAGNLYGMEIVTPRNDGSTGVLLIGNGEGLFKPLESISSGFATPKNVKAVEMIGISNKGKALLVGNNNDQLQLFILK